MARAVGLVVVVIADDVASTRRQAGEFVARLGAHADLVIALTTYDMSVDDSQQGATVRYVHPPQGLLWTDDDARRQVRWELVRDYSPTAWVMWAERGGLSFVGSGVPRLPRSEQVASITGDEPRVDNPHWVRLARPLIRPAAVCSLLTLAGVGVGLLHPWPLKIAVDALNGGAWAGLHGPAAIAAAMAAASVVLVIAGAALDYFATLISGRASERAAAEMRGMVLRRLLHMPMPFFDTYSSGELLTRLNGDVDRVQDGMLRIVMSVLPQAATLVGMVVVLLLIDPTLALVGLTAVPLLTVTTLLKRKPTDRLQRESRRRQGELQSTTSDLLRNARAIQGLGAEPWAVSRHAERTDLAVAAAIDSVEFSARVSPATDVILAVVSAVVLWLGVVRVSSGHLSVGSLLVVFSYLSGLYSPVRALARVGQTFSRTAASRDRLAEILTHPLPTESLLSNRSAVEVERRSPDSDRVRKPRQFLAVARNAPRRRSTVSLEHVSFAYGNGRPVLDDVELTLREGEHVCIVGPSGMGKTTLLHLLVRLYEPTSGVIKVEGVDVRDRPMEWLRSRLALVPQDCWILDATLRENLVLDTPDVIGVDIEQALRLALLEDVVARLPDGLETRLGEGGARLSGGERRRVALARALIRGAKVLLLDEPTSGLDPESERRIVASLQSVATRCTVLTVTHSPLVAAIADRALTLRNHQLVPLDITDGRISSPEAERERAS